MRARVGRSAAGASCAWPSLAGAGTGAWPWLSMKRRTTPVSTSTIKRASGAALRDLDHPLRGHVAAVAHRPAQIERLDLEGPCQPDRPEPAALHAQLVPEFRAERLENRPPLFAIARHVPDADAVGQRLDEPADEVDGFRPRRRAGPQQRVERQRADLGREDAPVPESLEERDAVPAPIERIDVEVGGDDGAQVVAERDLDGRQIVHCAQAHLEHALRRARGFVSEAIDQVRVKAATRQQAGAARRDAAEIGNARLVVSS